MVAAGLARRDDSSPANAEHDTTAARNLESYEVVYRVNELERMREETIVVGLPYESLRSSNRVGERTATLVNRDGLWQLTSGASPRWQRIDPGRRRAEGDVRPLGGLLLLEELGLAERMPDRRVLDRNCEAFRVAEPIGTVATRRPTPADHVDLCIDASGVLLHERWIGDGELIREQEAIELDLAPQLDDDVFAAELAPDARPALELRRELPLTDEIRAGLAVIFDLPASIKDDGGVAILHVDQLGQPVGGSVHRHLRRGTNLVDVEEVEMASVDTDRGTPHDVPMGDGFVETDLRTVTLTIVLPDDLAIRLRGPDLEILDTVAKAMRLAADENDE